MNSLQNILDAIRTYNPLANFELLRKVYNYTESALAGQRLRNGAPAISRPLAVAHTLALLRLDETMVAAGLLYDTALTMDGGSTACEDIQKNFGLEVADILVGSTTFSWTEFAYKKTHEEQRCSEHIRAMQLGLCEDIRVFLIMLADRIHTMRFLTYQPLHRHVRIARETMDIYIPPVHHLGLRNIEEELEELCFPYLQPGAHHYPASEEKTHELRDILDSLHEILHTAGIQAAIDGKIKHIRSIIQKQILEKLGMDENAWVMAFNVVVKNRRECYMALGSLYSAWRPVFGQLRDSIRGPESSLRPGLTAVFIAPHGAPFEVSIITEEMANDAKFGLLTYWWGKDGARVNYNYTLERKKLREMLERLEMLQHLLWNFTSLAMDDILVFTPKSIVQDLSYGATPVDFAYRIHTELGNHCVGAKINGSLLPLDTKLCNGDTVEIITHDKGYPRQDWLKFVKTNKARRFIRRFLRVNSTAKALPDNSPNGTKKPS